MTKKTIKASDVLGDNYYIYELTSSNYTPALNDTITITCTMKDVYGTAASGKSITLYQNGTSKGTQTTNNNGVATWSVTCSTGGLQKFNIKDRNIEVFVNNILDDFTIKTFTQTLKGFGDGGTYSYNTVVGDWEINLDLTNFNGNELTFQGLDYNFTIIEGSYNSIPCLVVEAGGYGTIRLNDSHVLYDDISSITISYTSSTKRIYINIYQDNTLIDNTDFPDRLNQFGTVQIHSNGILEGTVTSNLQVPIHYDSFDNKNQIDGDCILVYDMTFIDNNSDPSNYTFVNFTFGEYNGVVRYNNKIYLINEYKDHNNFNGFGDFIESYPVLTTDRQFTVKRYYLAQGAVITEWNDTISIIEQKYWHEGGHDRIHNASGIDEDESSLVQLASKYIFSDVKSVKSTAKELQTLIDDNRNNKVSSWSNPTTYSHYPSEKLVKDSLDNKQDKLVSGTNLKTLDGISLLGEGDITIDVSCGEDSTIIFEDDCSEDNTSDYTSISIRNTSGAETLTFNSTESAYACSRSNSGYALVQFGDVVLQNKMKISADIKLTGTSWTSNGILGFCDKDNPTNYGVGGWVQGETYYRMTEYYNGNELQATANDKWNGVSTSDYNHHELVYEDGIATYTLTNADGVTSKTLVLSLQRSNYIGGKVGLFVQCGSGTHCYIKNIRVETLGSGGSTNDLTSYPTSANIIHLGDDIMTMIDTALEHMITNWEDYE